MKIYQKLVTTFSLVLLLTLLFTGLASADVLQGRGRLYAKGSGLAVLKMSGKVEIIGHGKGTIEIAGAEKIEATGQGNRINGPEGRVVFKDYTGKITVWGRRMVVRMAGPQIEFTAKGKGHVLLKGRGIYKTANRTGDWAPDGLEMEVIEE